MTAAIPPALKAADIARFAQRAGQVEKAKPIVAYYCALNLLTRRRLAEFATGYYWIIDQVIKKDLHRHDDESKSYMLNLMDKLESVSLNSS